MLHSFNNHSTLSHFSDPDLFLVTMKTNIFVMYSLIYKRDPRTCAIFIPAWGSNWGSSGLSRYQNNHGLSDAYATSIYYGLSVKINTRKMLHGMQRLWTRLFLHLWSANPEDPPNLSPTADNSITRGGIQGLGSPLYICGCTPTKQRTSLSRSILRYGQLKLA